MFCRDLLSEIEIMLTTSILPPVCTLVVEETMPRGMYVDPDQLRDLQDLGTMTIKIVSIKYNYFFNYFRPINICSNKSRCREAWIWIRIVSSVHIQKITNSRKSKNNRRKTTGALEVPQACPNHRIKTKLHCSIGDSKTSKS